MTDLAPFALRPGAELSADWLAWLGSALRVGGAAPPEMPGDLAGVLPALEAHGVLPLVYLNLRDSPTWAALPLDVQEASAQAFRSSALRSYLMEAELVRIVAALAAARIPVALTKGAATGRTLYESPASRPVNDLDLLIPAAAVDDAALALAPLGYLVHGPFGRGWFGRWQRRYRCELQMVCAVPEQRGLLVELHWSLVELPYLVDRIPMQEVWASVQAFAALPGALAPDPAILLLHTCAHLALHHSRDLRLIWLVDVDRLARWEMLDWDAVTDRAGRWGLGLAVHASLAAAAAWLGTPAPAASMARLAVLAGDPVGQTMWGLGDEQPGRAWRRARATWAAFDGRQRLSYVTWLFLRVLARPLEAARRRAYQRGGVWRSMPNDWRQDGSFGMRKERL